MARASLLLELTALYNEPGRDYHDIRHVAELLTWGKAFPLDEIQTWAVWFHDAIYDTTRKDSEELSAQLAEARLPALGYDEAFVSEVAQIVRDTIKHIPTTPRSEAVCDVDLAPLSIPTAEFIRNRDRIRFEWAQATDEEFKAGTRKFAESMLARDRIYVTPWGTKREAQARENLLLLLE